MCYSNFTVRNFSGVLHALLPFFWLKINKSPGHDGRSFNVKKKVLVSYVNLLKDLFNLSIVKEIFPDDLKIEKFTAIY